VEKEEDVEVARKKDSKSGVVILGWKIRCPLCNRKVFFVCTHVLGSFMKKLINKTL